MTLTSLLGHSGCRRELLIGQLGAGVLEPRERYQRPAGEFDAFAGQHVGQNGVAGQGMAEAEPLARAFNEVRPHRRPKHIGCRRG